MNPMHELAALIERTAEANGWTQAQIAKRATDHGHTLTVQNLSRIKHEPVKTLVPKTIEALAIGLQLPEPVVAAAALQSMGISVSATPPADATEAVRRDPRLSVRDKRIALTVLDALLTTEKEQADDTPPNSRAGESPAADLTSLVETQDVTFDPRGPVEADTAHPRGPQERGRHG